MDPADVVVGLQLANAILQTTQALAAGEITPEQAKAQWQAAVADVTGANQAWDAAGKPAAS